MVGTTSRCTVWWTSRDWERRRARSAADETQCDQGRGTVGAGLDDRGHAHAPSGAARGSRGADGGVGAEGAQPRARGPDRSFGPAGCRGQPASVAAWPRLPAVEDSEAGGDPADPGPEPRGNDVEIWGDRPRAICVRRSKTRAGFGEGTLKRRKSCQIAAFSPSVFQRVTGWTPWLYLYNIVGHHIAKASALAPIR